MCCATSPRRSSAPLAGKRPACRSMSAVDGRFSR
jgi:hypothetical protein